MKIKDITKDPVINIALDTINLDKQAIVFCASKRSAEKQAEDIAKKIKLTDTYLDKLSNDFLNSLSNPTKQCIRGANCLKKGVAFHHAGLVTKQRNIVEEGFRSGHMKIICATPTLACGLDMPAFRTILKDLKRYSGRWGMQFIPVLEYLQMAGRAGRPGKEDYGESICISSSQLEKEIIKDTFIYGEVESIQSKLAVEPVLRTYVLSLIASGFLSSKKELINFFSKTFYAFQFGDMHKLSNIINRVIDLLFNYGFIEYKDRDANKDFDFVTANNINSDLEQVINATPIGNKVSELYLDPYTANFFIESLTNAKKKIGIDLTIGLIQTISETIEMSPLLSVRKADYDSVETVLIHWQDLLFREIPKDYDCDDFLSTIKTSLFFKAWIDETDEEIILEKFNMRPGETRSKLDIADWLLRCLIELAKFNSLNDLIPPIVRLHTRMKYGVSEELLPLLKLRGVGRVRSRKLYNYGFRTIKDFTEEKFEQVKSVVGDGIAEKIYTQIGRKFKRNDLTDFM